MGIYLKSAVTWLYYKDLPAMQDFFQDVLGLDFIVDQGWTKIYQVSKTGFIGLVDEKKGMHKYTEKKAVNVSFILDDLEAWFEYVKYNKPFELRSNELEVGPEMKYKAFVGYDPEGYFLEFDQFFPHDENVRLMKYLHPE